MPFFARTAAHTRQRRRNVCCIACVCSAPHSQLIDASTPLRHQQQAPVDPRRLSSSSSTQSPRNGRERGPSSLLLRSVAPPREQTIGTPILSPLLRRLAALCIFLALLLLAHAPSAMAQDLTSEGGANQGPLARVVVLGARGRTGRLIVQHLKAAGAATVVAVARNTSGEASDGVVEWVQGDVKDEAGMATLFEGASAVVFAAGASEGWKLGGKNTPKQVDYEAVVRGWVVGTATFMRHVRSQHINRHTHAYRPRRRAWRWRPRCLAICSLAPPLSRGPSTLSRSCSRRKWIDHSYDSI